ncbi:MAG: hypothetical protein SGJ09_01720 [Phycisphaerae bacterium]|nr:hypothetical protein [Phycisphaerae bacterium]
MKEHQRIALERGLAEFDRAVARRKTRRRAVTGGALALALVAVALIATRFGIGSNQGTPLPNVQFVAVRQPLPSYVEVIEDDAQLTVELELASACERIGRNAGRIYVMECTRGGG